MTLLVYYVALSLAADAVAVLLCLWIERIWPAASLPIFLALYFAILWFAWVLAVRLTEPKVKPAAPGTPYRQPAE